MRTQLIKGLLLLLMACTGAYSNEESGCKDNPRFGFYTQLDGISFNSDTEDIIEHDNNFHDCVRIPRSRFFVIGKYFDIAYELAFDAAEEDIRDFYFRSEKYKNFWLTIGQLKTPYNFWFLMSQSQFNFLEQSLPGDAFGLGFRVGVMAQFFTEHATLSACVIGPEANNTVLGNQVYGHVPLAGVGRITVVPIHKEKKVIHFGLAGIFQDTDSLGRFRFNSVPEVRGIYSPTLVDTGFIYQCKNYKGIEAEAILILKSLTFSAEYYQTDVNRNITDLSFSGSSFVADYFLTGEHYIYNFKEGCIDTLSKIRHCYGAWQVTLRYSILDLQDGDINGGKENNFTIGLNCWLNNHLKFLANYIIADADPSSNGLDRHLNIFALRLQLSS